jgi:hypothetical protein
MRKKLQCDGNHFFDDSNIIMFLPFVVGEYFATGRCKSL